MSPSSTSVEVEVGGRQLKLSNFDKVLYPEAGFTKGQVIDYYSRIAPALLPHLHQRALTLKRYPNGPDKAAIVFETGYGPSGLPHLGTFQEVARTQMVRHALSEMVDWPTRLIAFSDDMDGMRKVPPGVPGPPYGIG